jgi:hypothetical protein
MDTLIAGYANGLLGIWNLKDGKRLHDEHLHGAVLHLLLDGGRLYAATELGQHRVLDLRVFTQDYCSLVREIWSKVPFVWEGGLPVRRRPDPQHRCHKQ